MAVQNPFFGKREPESFQPRSSSTTSGSVLGTNAVNNSAASAQPVPPAADPKPSSASDSSGKVNCKIRYGKLVVEEGCQLAGEIEAGFSSSSSSSAQRAAAPLRAEPAALAA